MRVEELWLRYSRGGPWVLQGIDVSARPGQVVVLTGRNGVGKSTLLQVIAGVLTPTRGRVLDRPRRIGWVPEKFPVEQPFTAREYLRFMAPGAAVDPWLEKLGLTAYRDVRLAELSKGTAQKVGLAQAIVVEPELLILDEPWEGLDAATRDLVPDLVRGVAEAGGIVLISDHRGETVRLPGATHWTLAEGALTVVAPDPLRRTIIEIAVPAADAPAALEALRAAGHDILRVRASA